RDDVGSGGETSIHEGARNRRFNVDLAPRNHSGENCGYSDVQDGADQQRGDNANRQVALRIFRFLRGSGNGVKSDVGEEDVSSACAYTSESIGSEFRPAVSPVAGIHELRAQS